VTISHIKHRKGEQLQQILGELVAVTPEVLIAIAASRQGLSIASVKNGTTPAEEEALAVAAARILDMAADVNKQLAQGDIGRILIEGAHHTTIVTAAGPDVILIVTVPADAKLGLAMVSIKRTARQIALVYD
jgi:predicted regulator of Ras-like GTPase activity (Roadblock/LC7/MglB family)